MLSNWGLQQCSWHHQQRFDNLTNVQSERFGHQRDAKWWKSNQLIRRSTDARAAELKSLEFISTCFERSLGECARHLEGLDRSGYPINPDSATVWCWQVVPPL